MNREEIENRIFLCEAKESAYREVGNTKTANRYSNEKYKWEQLLSQLRSDEDEETIRIYKRGYYQQKNRWDKLKEFVTLKEKPKVFGAKNGKTLELAMEFVFDMVLDKMNELEKRDGE